MRLQTLAVTGALCLGLFSCSQEAKQTSKQATSDIQSTAANEAVLAADEPQEEQQQQQPQQRLPVKPGTQPKFDSVAPATTAANVDWDKKIIKTATLKLEVKDFKKYNDQLHANIKKYGGYVAGEDNYFTADKSEMLVTIKVPVARFEMLLNEMSGGDIKVMERNIRTEDVGSQLIDTKSRLEAKKDMRTKYLEFLKQSKNMKEVLQVQNEINNIQEEIESAAGRIQYLANQSAYSTIQLTFYQPLAGYVPVDGTPSFFVKLSAAFSGGLSLLKTIFIGLTSIWPLIIAAALAFFFWRKKKQAKFAALVNQVRRP